MSKREQILTAALKLFNENGFERTPTSKISLEAGVATGTLFHHFNTKEDLIDALYWESKSDVGLTLKQGLASAREMRDQFRIVWFNAITWVLENPERHNFLMQFRESPYISGAIRARADETFRFMSDIVSRGQDEGKIRMLPIDLLMALNSGNLIAAANYFLSHQDEFNNPEISEEAFNSFWAGMSIC